MNKMPKLIKNPYPILQTVPFGGWVIKDLTSHGHHNLPKEIISTEHVAVPNADPHGSSFDFVQRHNKLKVSLYHNLYIKSNQNQITFVLPTSNTFFMDFPPWLVN